MVTFTRLLVIRIVASVRSESSRRARIALSLSKLLSSNSLISLGVNEKKAISEPDAKPENNRRTAASITAKMAPMEGAMIVTSLNIC